MLSKDNAPTFLSDKRHIVRLDYLQLHAMRIFLEFTFEQGPLHRSRLMRQIVLKK